MIVPNPVLGYRGLGVLLRLFVHQLPVRTCPGAGAAADDAACSSPISTSHQRRDWLSPLPLPANPTAFDLYGPLPPDVEPGEVNPEEARIVVISDQVAH